MRSAPTLLVPKLLIVIVLPLVDKLNLSSVKTSTPPSDLMREYLSSSKERKVSFAAERVTDAVLFVISTENCLLTKISD